MSKNKQQNFLQGAAILAVTVAAIKVMGAIYKIPLGNILGDEGYGHFSVAYSIYSVLLSISTAGLPVALSRMIAASNAEGRPRQVIRTFSVARITFFVLGLAATLVMILFPEQLAVLMDDKASAASISALAPSIVLVCLMSAYRGYTQGLSNMIPTSVSQILEVLGKLVFGLVLARWILASGKGIPMASAGAIAGVSIGSLMALLYVVYYKYKMDKEAPKQQLIKDIPLSRLKTLKQLVSISIPVAIGSSILSILTLIDTKLILNRLQEAAGFSAEQATVYFGVYSKVQTIFNLPYAFIVPVSISIIPAISAYLALKNNTGAARVTEASLKLTSLLALPAGVGLTVLSYPIVNVLYPGSHTDGPAILAILGIASFFVCLTQLTNAILQAYGHERFPVYTMAIGGIIKLVSTWFLVSDPNIAVRGAAIGTLLCYLAISLINMVIMYIKLPEKPSLLKTFSKPILSTFVMGASAYLIYNLLLRLLDGMGKDVASRGILLLIMLLAIILAVIIYLIMIIVTKSITQEDLALIPKGGKIAKILRLKK